MICLPRIRLGAPLASVLLLVLASLPPTRSDDVHPEEAPLLILRNGPAVCGVLPRVGGRILSFRSVDGPNLLDARPALWPATPSTSPSPTPLWRQYY